MEKQSIHASRAAKSAVESVAKIIFVVCGAVGIAAVCASTFYMILSGVPAVLKVGLPEILFNSVWSPTGQNPQFGILYIILTSVVGTFFAERVI